MPVLREASHIALANKNHEVLLRLMETPDRFPEWITTVAFYKALQVVEAVFARNRGLPPCSSHHDRLRVLKFPQFHLIEPHYRVLWAVSGIARYLHDSDTKTPYTSFTDYLPADKVVEKMVIKRLRPIEQGCVGMLSDAGKKALLRIP